MSSTPALLRGLDILIGASLFATTVSVWLAFGRPMCANSVGGTCSPNVVYVAVALLTGLLAVGSVAVRRRTSE